MSWGAHPRLLSRRGIIARRAWDEVFAHYADGEQAISTLKVGDQVEAYDPATHQTTVQTVQHLFINHDNDLVDVKLRADDASTALEGTKPKPAANGQVQSRAPPQGKTTNQQTSSLDETLHTTAKHPFLTVAQGWVQAGQLQPGMHVLRADGSIGVVEAMQVIPGAGTRYDLEVSNVHTFEVGLGQWVVHNCKFSDLKTTVEANEFGTTVRTGVEEDHSMPYFESWLSKDGSTFEWRKSYRKGLTEHASDVYTQHFLLAGGDPSKLKIIRRVNVENSDTIKWWYKYNTLVGSNFDKSVNFFARDLGIGVGPPAWEPPGRKNIIFHVL